MFLLVESVLSLEETVKEKGKWVVANERVIEQGSGLAVVVEVLVRDCGTQHCELAEADEEDGQADHSHDNFASECGENGTLGLHTNTSSANTQNTRQQTHKFKKQRTIINNGEVLVIAFYLLGYQASPISQQAVRWSVIQVPHVAGAYFIQFGWKCALIR